MHSALSCQINSHAVGLRPKGFQFVAAHTGRFRHRAIAAKVGGRNAICAIVGEAAGGNKRIAVLYVRRKPEALGYTGSTKAGVDYLVACRDCRAARRPGRLDVRCGPSATSAVLKALSIIIVAQKTWYGAGAEEDILRNPCFL